MTMVVVSDAWIEAQTYSIGLISNRLMRVPFKYTTQSAVSFIEDMHNAFEDNGVCET